MRKVFLLMLFFLSYLVVGFEITEVSVRENERAQIEVVGNLGSDLPHLKMEKGIIEITFPGTTLSEKNFKNRKLEIVSPHVLLKQVSAFEESGSVKIRLGVNGSLDALKERFELIPSERGLLLGLNYPDKNASTLKLTQLEQSPLGSPEVLRSKDHKSSFSTIGTVIILFLAFTAVLGFFFVRYTKKQSGLKGSRKYLIEQMSFFPLGPKSGVSLLKIGNEFVLLGVTPQNITHLSGLPKLQEQYEEESGFERGLFKESVAEEIKRMRVA